MMVGSKRRAVILSLIESMRDKEVGAEKLIFKRAHIFYRN